MVSYGQVMSILGTLSKATLTSLCYSVRLTFCNHYLCWKWFNVIL